MKTFVHVETDTKEGGLHILSHSLKDGTVCAVDRSSYAGEAIIENEYCDRYEVVSGGHRRFIYRDNRQRWFFVRP